MNYYLARDGQTYGPYPEESIPTMLQAGQVVPEDLLCPEGGSEWVPLNEIPTFAPATPPPIPQAAVSAPPAGLRISAPAPQTHPTAVVSPAVPKQTFAPARPPVMQSAGSVFSKIKLVAYGIGAVVVAGIVIAGFIAGRREAKEIEKLHPLPGWNAFAAGDGKIDSESMEAGYGNTSEATQLSTRLASVLGVAQKENFTIEKRSGYRGRSKIGRITSAVNSAGAGEGKFQTFLEMRDDRAILLIHVPEFKRYKGDTRESMRQMCWEIARVAVTAAKKNETRAVTPPPPAAPVARTPVRTTAGRRIQTNNVVRVAKPAVPEPPKDLTLVVGLRDKKSYDCVFAGKLADLSPSENMLQAATGNVPSHQLLVQWFGADKPN